MSTTTYTTTIDFDHRAKRDDRRRNNTREVWRREDNRIEQKITEGKRLYEVDDRMVSSIVVIGERRGRGRGNVEPKK